MICMIAAMTKDGVIGHENKLLWHIPEELKHFKETTSGQTVIMGRKTFESIGRALPNRHNIVISSTATSLGGVTVCKNLGDALAAARAWDTDIYVIGGASVYAQAIPYAEKLIISYVKGVYEGDAKFPAISDKEWLVESSTPHDAFDVVIYRRR